METNNTKNEEENCDKREAHPEGECSPYSKGHAKDFKQETPNGHNHPQPSWPKLRSMWSRACQSETSTGIMAVSTLVMALFTIIITIVTAYNVQIANRQWAVAKSTLESGNDSFSKTLAEMQKQSAAMRDAASASRESNTIILESSRIDQRPYLVTTVPIFVEPPSAGKEIKANVTIKNIGKTPAVKILTELTLKPFHASKTDRRPYIAFINSTFAELRRKTVVGREEIKRTGAEHDIAPGGDFFSTNQNSVVIPIADFPLVRTGEITIMYTGIISYTDSFNGNHATEFCYQYFGTDAKTWLICDSNNSIK